MVGQRFVEIVAQVPTDTEAVSDDLHQLALGPQSFEEKHKLELKENHRIDAGATRRGVAVPNQFPDE